MKYTMIIVKKLDDPNSQAVTKVYDDVRNWCNSRGIRHYTYDPTITYERGEDKDASAEESQVAVIAIGGDGTVIAAAKLAWELNAPVIGFNLGKVGFLADFPPRSVDQTLTAYLHDRLVEEVRGTIRFFAGPDSGEDDVAINDIVISCAQSDTALEYDLIVGDYFAGTHQANGVIMSTPTGSTAYALGVGGPIMLPECQDIMEIVPIAPQTLTSRPLIVPAGVGASIRFLVKPGKPVTVRVDGVIRHTFEAADKPTYEQVLIRASSEKVRLLHHSGWNHFHALTQKLGWNK